MTPASRDIKIRSGIEKPILTPNRAAMASAMELDGQYAVAQVEKLDWFPLFQGRCIPICHMLAE